MSHVKSFFYLSYSRNQYCILQTHSTYLIITITFAERKTLNMINLSPIMLILKFDRSGFGWFTVDTNDTVYLYPVYLYPYVCGKQRAGNKCSFRVLRRTTLCSDILIFFMMEQIHEEIIIMSFCHAFRRELE